MGIHAHEERRDVQISRHRNWGALSPGAVCGVNTPAWPSDADFHCAAIAPASYAGFRRLTMHRTIPTSP